MIILMMAIAAWPVSASGQSKSNADPLKAYTTCKLPDDLKVKEVTRRPKSAKKYREVTTAKGTERGVMPPKYPEILIIDLPVFDRRKK